jgi:hypothetical protein
MLSKQKSQLASDAMLRKMIIALLNAPKGTLTLDKDVNSWEIFPSHTRRKLLQILHNRGLVYVKGGFIEISCLQRIKLAAKGLELGVDYETLSSLLEWKEFERVTALALEKHGYDAQTNVRFKYSARRWEIDVVGYRKPLILCVDCKHWHHGLPPSRAANIAEEQERRTLSFLHSFPNPDTGSDCASWREMIFVPVIVTLIPAKTKFIYQVPMVPILQLNNFLTELPMQLCSIKSFVKHTSFRVLK